MKRWLQTGSCNINTKSCEQSDTATTSKAASAITTSSSCSHDELGAPQKRLRRTVQEPPHTLQPDCIDDSLIEPQSIMTWNMNGIRARLKTVDSERALVHDITSRDADIMCWQEVRYPARTSPHSSRRRDELGGKLSERNRVLKFLNRRELRCYRKWWSLADKGYAGTLTLVHNRVCGPHCVRFTLDCVEENIHSLCSKGIDDGDGLSCRLRRIGKTHNQDGRVAVLVFNHFTLLHTYAPNNGGSIESHQRRIQWDQRVLSFVEKLTMKQPLIWTGDLNIAPDTLDMSHPSYFKAHNQPGCTDAEQDRFRQFQIRTRLVDVYRKLHPNVGIRSHTWRGSDFGKHANHSMRIDHFLLSPSLIPHISSCENADPSKRSSFIGSDHCPVQLKIKSTLYVATSPNTPNTC